MNMNKVCFNQNAILNWNSNINISCLIFNNLNSCPPCNPKIIYKEKEEKQMNNEIIIR